MSVNPGIPLLITMLAIMAAATLPGKYDMLIDNISTVNVSVL